MRSPPESRRPGCGQVSRRRGWHAHGPVIAEAHPWTGAKARAGARDRQNRRTHASLLPTGATLSRSSRGRVGSGADLSQKDRRRIGQVRRIHDAGIASRPWRGGEPRGIRRLPPARQPVILSAGRADRAHRRGGHPAQQGARGCRSSRRTIDASRSGHPRRLGRCRICHAPFGAADTRARLEVAPVETTRAGGSWDRIARANQDARFSPDTEVAIK